MNKESLHIHDKVFEEYLSEETILSIVRNIAGTINSRYEGKELLFVAVLNGSFMFASDLLKEVSLPCSITFVKMTSYQGTSSTGRVDQLIGLNTSLAGKHVVILEDIVDTGLTLEKLRTLLGEDAPESLIIATLLFKPNAFQGKHVPELVGLEIPNDFVVGYGLDYNEHGRNLRSIYKLKEN